MHKLNTRLSATIQNNKKLHYDIQRLDLFFKSNFQKYIFLVNGACQKLLHDDKKLNKVKII